MWISRKRFERLEYKITKLMNPYLFEIGETVYIKPSFFNRSDKLKGDEAIVLNRDFDYMSDIALGTNVYMVRKVYDGYEIEVHENYLRKTLWG